MARNGISAPSPRPPKYGLVATAPTIDDQQEWHDGARFAPEGCNASGRVAVGCRGDTTELDSNANPAVIGFDPFVVYATDWCSSFGFQSRDYKGRAQRALLAAQSFQIADELWSGSLNDDATSPTDNRELVDPSSDVLTNGAVSPLDALACVEAGLASYGQGRQGMVHVTAQMLPYLVNNYVVRLDGTTYVTPNGHLLVPDAGYDGSGPLLNGAPQPALTSQWMFGTSMLYLRMSDIEVPGDYTTNLDRSTNTVTFYAQRMVGVEWGDECAHVAAEINIAPCLTGGAS